MAQFTTAVPTGGLAGSVGSTVLYVPTIGPTAGTATLYYKYGPTDTEWCLIAAGGVGGAEPRTTDPRTAGLARAIGATCLYVTGGTGTVLYKYGSSDTAWCTWSPTATVYQSIDADLTALAASPATAGLVERTGAATYATRLLGVAAGTSVPTTADINAGITLNKTAGVGIKVDPASPSWPWRDITSPIRPKASGVGSPTSGSFLGGTYLAFSFAANDTCSVDFHIPHDWVPGTNLFVHLHWGHNGTAISGSLVTDFYASASKGHNQANFPAEVTITMTVSTPDIATVPRYRHRVDEVQLSAAGGAGGLLDTDAIEVDGLVLIGIKPTTIPTITGGTPNRPFILFCDLHYQSTSTGTLNKAPSFYV